MTFQGLIVTVGTSPEPVRKVVEEHQPPSVLFVVSPDSRASVEEKILPELPYVPQCRFAQVSDAESMETCYQEIHKEIQGWLEERQLEPPDIYVDITGGTKIMSAALALAAVDKLIGSFTYVGGDRRDLDNRWVVVSGFERVVESRNPLQAYAIRDLERANWLLTEFHAGAAAEVLRDAAENCDESQKSRLDAFSLLTKSLDSADRFQFTDAIRKFDRCRKSLELILDYSTFTHLVSVSRHWRKVEKDLRASNRTPGHETLLDLLANAERRAKQARYDDAVGRLYRAVELRGQQFVKQAFDSELGKPSLDDFPSSRHEEVIQKLGQPKGDEYMLGVKALYQALDFSQDEAMSDQAGVYESLSKHLSTRNMSILAHGLQPISKTTFDKFWTDALEALDIDESDIPRWPELDLKLR